MNEQGHRQHGASRNGPLNPSQDGEFAAVEALLFPLRGQRLLKGSLLIGRGGRNGRGRLDLEVGQVGLAPALWHGQTMGRKF